jgi:hypothetical protein
MIRAPKGGMRRWRTVMAAMAVLGLMAGISLPAGAAQPGGDIEQEIREATTPAVHRALAAFYEQKAQAAQQLASKYFIMREVYAAARAMERKDRAGEHWVQYPRTFYTDLNGLFCKK